MTVAAPDEAAAIAAAGEALKLRWQAYSFYAFCAVTPVVEVKERE